MLAPLAVSAMDEPLQMADVNGLTVIVGNGFTVTVVIAVFTQPFASVPVTNCNSK